MDRIKKKNRSEAATEAERDQAKSKQRGPNERDHSLKRKASEEDRFGAGRSQPPKVLNVI